MKQCTGRPFLMRCRLAETGGCRLASAPQGFNAHRGWSSLGSVLVFFVVVAQRVQQAVEIVVQATSLFLAQRTLRGFQHALLARGQLLVLRGAFLGQFDAQRAAVLLVRATAQIALALQLVELTRHGAAV